METPKIDKFWKKVNKKTEMFKKTVQHHRFLHVYVQDEGFYEGVVLYFSRRGNLMSSYQGENIEGTERHRGTKALDSFMTDRDANNMAAEEMGQFNDEEFSSHLFVEYCYNNPHKK